MPVLVTLVRDDTPEAVNIAADYASPEDAHSASKPQSLLARAMLRRMLCEATATVIDEWTFGRGENARPLAFHRSGPSPFAISISHSGRHVAAAITRAEAIGIDIEQKNAWRDLGGIALFAFGPEERKLVEAEGIPAFYRIWTLREAFAKATGDGLTRATDGMDRFAAPRPFGTFTEIAMPGHWFASYDEPEPGLSCAIAVRFPRKPPSTPVRLWR